MAADQRPQCRVHEERAAGVGAGFDSATGWRRAQTPEAARAEGVAIAREMLIAVHGRWCRERRSAPHWDDTVRRSMCWKRLGTQPLAQA